MFNMQVDSKWKHTIAIKSNFGTKGIRITCLLWFLLWITVLEIGYSMLFQEVFNQATCVQWIILHLLVHLFRGQELNTNLFSQMFRAPPGYPSKIPGRPARKRWFPWLWGTYRIFGPHPFKWKTPTPPEDIRTQKFGVGLFFLAWLLS